MLAAILLGLLQLSHALPAYTCDGKTTAEEVAESIGQSLTGKTFVITGGDSGLGRATAVALARGNATLYIGSLSPDTHGADAVKNITNTTGNDKVTVLGVDLSNLTSVRSFASSYLQLQGPTLDVLINDAGIGHNPSSLTPMTADGFERVFQVNYLGHFLLTELLRPALLAGPTPGRVINVASAAAYDACSWASAPKDCANAVHLPPPVRAAGNNSEGAPISNYGLSKFLQVQHAAELAEQSGEGLLAFSLHPGFVDTPMAQELTPATKKEWCRHQSQPCPITSEMGASTQTYLAIAPSSMIGSTSGSYYTQCQVVDTPPAHDKTADVLLFQDSVKWVNANAM